MAYDDDARAAITALKNRDQRARLWAWAEALAPLVPPGPVVVTWAPTAPARRRRRGFDQAELLARAVARRCGLPCVSLLRRGPGPPQAGRTRAARRAHPGFRVVATVPAEVLLVDDVATTGATLMAAARALREAGAASVHGLVVARAG